MQCELESIESQEKSVLIFYKGHRLPSTMCTIKKLLDETIGQKWKDLHPKFHCQQAALPPAPYPVQINILDHLLDDEKSVSYLLLTWSS